MGDGFNKSTGHVVGVCLLSVVRIENGRFLFSRIVRIGRQVAVCIHQRGKIVENIEFGKEGWRNIVALCRDDARQDNSRSAVEVVIIRMRRLPVEIGPGHFVAVPVIGKCIGQDIPVPVAFLCGKKPVRIVIEEYRCVRDIGHRAINRGQVPVVVEGVGGSPSICVNGIALPIHQVIAIAR